MAKLRRPSIEVLTRYAGDDSSSHVVCAVGRSIPWPYHDYAPVEMRLAIHSNPPSIIASRILASNRTLSVVFSRTISKILLFLSDGEFSCAASISLIRVFDASIGFFGRLALLRTAAISRKSTNPVHSMTFRAPLVYSSFINVSRSVLSPSEPLSVTLLGGSGVRTLRGVDEKRLPAR
jgi:hypothetical protein